jgi:predicted aldo/keto reductase-like oxidoreductase
MNYRRLGRTNLMVSVVGFGTCQLRLVPERQAIATLVRGFELGVNFVHTAPDYEGAEDLIARAVREASREVIVCSQGYGAMDQFERHFEETCRRFDKERLVIFGISCIEDSEALGRNVWGQGGMVDFLLRKKADGRLGSIFCSTHHPPSGIIKLIESGVFDALMVAYNPLGFHITTECAPPLGTDPAEDPFDARTLRRRRENGFADLRGTFREVFPVAHAHDVGLMIMKPLAGGLLCEPKAFPLWAPLHPEVPRVPAREILRHILRSPEVACVVPGTASPAEAEENARAGHGEIALAPEEVHQVESDVAQLETVLCSRCGQCTTSCSQGLWVPWLLRSGYTALHATEMSAWSPDELGYFHLHPSLESICASCPNVTCTCPSGLDIPRELTQVHETMVGLLERKLVPSPPFPSLLEIPEALRGLPESKARAIHRRYRSVKARLPKSLVSLLGVGRRRLRALRERWRSQAPRARMITQDLPEVLAPSATAVCRLHLENRGPRTWQTSDQVDGSRVVLRVYVDGRARHPAYLRIPVAPWWRGHFVFELGAPDRPGIHRLRLDLVTEGTRSLLGRNRTTLVRTRFKVTDVT